MKYTPGVLVAYATAPGGTASDGGSGGGVYARALSAAKALALTLPHSLLARADENIE